MNTTIDELAAPAGEELSWMSPRQHPFEGAETESVFDHRRHDDNVKSARPLDQSLLKLLYELVVGKPAMADVQALRIWLCSQEDRLAPLQLPMDGLPEKLRVGMELPLDDSIARWVWQHQRPLVIAAEEETRFPDFARLLLEWGVKCFCAVPLTLANRRIGVLGLASAKQESLESFDLEFVQRGAANIAKGKKDESEWLDEDDTQDGFRGKTLSLEDDTPLENNFEGIIGRSPLITALCKQIKVVAPTGSTALILGETGTGKELIARAIHNLSPRRNRPFIKVNCAAIPAGLIESELFGHERGAFTGAVARRTGRFEMADGGTLFLDEIGDIPFELQPKLLRVLQEQEFERVGSTQTTRVNVRIVAATSRDLPRMVADREFRADLYYRLNVFPVRVPALRERLEDIPLLVRHFIEVYSSKAGKRLTDVAAETMDILLGHTWPGNVRELQNVIERAIILSTGRVLRPSLDELQPCSQAQEAIGVVKEGQQTTLKDAEREHIIRALATTNWVVGGPEGAAARLGLQRTTLIAKMQKLGISRAQA